MAMGTRRALVIGSQCAALPDLSFLPRVATWTRRSGDAGGALRLFRRLLADEERCWAPTTPTPSLHVKVSRVEWSTAVMGSRDGRL
jgi:hypothetical protein